MIRISMTLVIAVFLAVSCEKQQNIQTKEDGISALQPSGKIERKLHVEVQDDLVTVTDRQLRLVAGVNDLSEGMSQQDVKDRLGDPIEGSPETLFYKCVESRIEGGHFVTATLLFGHKGLASAKVDFGHVTLEPRTEK